MRDVLAVRGDDERRPDGPCRDERPEAGRNEEVRVDDIGPEAAGAPGSRAREPQVAQLAAAAAIENDPLDLVAARGELALEPLHEDAEVGRRGGRGTSARRAGSASGESC